MARSWDGQRKESRDHGGSTSGSLSRLGCSSEAVLDLILHGVVLRVFLCLTGPLSVGEILPTENGAGDRGIPEDKPERRMPDREGGMRACMRIHKRAPEVSIGLACQEPKIERNSITENRCFRRMLAAG
jgi:hypothetical protein